MTTDISQQVVLSLVRSSQGRPKGSVTGRLLLEPARRCPLQLVADDGRRVTTSTVRSLLWVEERSRLYVQTENSLYLIEPYEESTGSSAEANTPFERRAHR